jgi:hypothetical protein
VEGFCVPSGTQKPSTLPSERAAGAQKTVINGQFKSPVEHSLCGSI